MQLILCKLGREWPYWHCQKHLPQEQSLTHKLNGAELSVCPLLRTSTTSSADGTLPSAWHRCQHPACLLTGFSSPKHMVRTQYTVCLQWLCREGSILGSLRISPYQWWQCCHLSWTKDITGDRTGSLKTSKGPAVWFPVQALFLLRPSLENSRNHSPA